jgi:hypothetical protein
LHNVKFQHLELENFVTSRVKDVMSIEATCESKHSSSINVTSCYNGKHQPLSDATTHDASSSKSKKFFFKFVLVLFFVNHHESKLLFWWLCF